MVDCFERKTECVIHHFLSFWWNQTWHNSGYCCTYPPEIDHRISDPQEMSPFEYEPEILQRLPHPLRKEVILYIHRCFPGWFGWQRMERFTCFVFLSCIDDLEPSETLPWNLKITENQRWSAKFPPPPLFFRFLGFFSFRVFFLGVERRYSNFLALSTRHLLNSKLLLFKDPLPSWFLGIIEENDPSFITWTPWTYPTLCQKMTINKEL